MSVDRRRLGGGLASSSESDSVSVGRRRLGGDLFPSPGSDLECLGRRRPRGGLGSTSESRSATCLEFVGRSEDVVLSVSERVSCSELSSELLCAIRQYVVRCADKGQLNEAIEAKG